MINMIKSRNGGSHSRLLATASAAVLISAMFNVEAWGESRSAGQPPVWISFAWHSEHVQGTGDPFSPDFLGPVVAAGFTSPVVGERNLSHSYGDEGKVSFQPGGSNWIYSASVRYGRAHGGRSSHEQTNGPTYKVAHYSTLSGSPIGTSHVNQHDVRFLDVSAVNNETHFIIDFKVGKDVGLGMLGHNSTSVLSGGIRFVQLRSSQDVPRLDGDPDFSWTPFHQTEFFGGAEILDSYNQSFHNYFSSAQSTRSFNGIGPSISWDAAASVYGEPRSGEISVDWSVSAAALFGRQKVKSHHETVGQQHCYGGFSQTFGCGHVDTVLYSKSTNSARSRSIVVPNIGGTIGFSYRVADFKFSAGYRADYFLHAIDAGIDVRREVTSSFNGPFVRVSLGIGD